MRSKSHEGAPDILVASYGIRFRLIWSVMAATATAVVVGAAVADAAATSHPEPIFTIAATVFFVLTGGLLLTVWRDRISFKDDGMRISRRWSTVWKAYDDITAIGRAPDRVDLGFRDGSKASINRHMADLSQVLSLLTVKAPGR